MARTKQTNRKSGKSTKLPRATFTASGGASSSNVPNSPAAGAAALLNQERGRNGGGGSFMRRTFGFGRRRNRIPYGAFAAMANLGGYSDSDDNSDWSGDGDEDHQSNDGGESQEIIDLDIAKEECFGYLRGEIVGLRYYNGEVSRGEIVQLAREPGNKYDPNAVAVKNSGGDQIGHIKREMAAALAPIIDGKLARVEAQVPTNKNTYSMAVDMTLYGTAENAQKVKDSMTKSGYKLSDQAPKGGDAGKSHVEGTDAAAMAEFSKYSSVTKTLSNDELNKELDKMFENLREEDKLLYMDPPDLISSKLYPHQKQALAWMVKRENGDDLPPFWIEIESKADKRVLYKNTITAFGTNRRPESFHGGILADDMGLGKTLEVISLIASNGVDGKPIKLRQHIEAANGSVKKRAGSSKKNPGRSSSTKSVSVIPKSSVSDVVFKKLNASRQRASTVDSESDDSDTEFVMQRSKIPAITSTPATPAASASVSSRDIQTKAPPSKRAKLTRIESFDSDTEGPLAANATKSQDASSLALTTADGTQDTNGYEQDGEEDLPSLDDPELVQLNGVKKRFQFEAMDDLAADAPRATLIVCPMSVMQNWEDQIEQHFNPGAYRYLMIHRQYGNNILNASDLKKMDVVITTYQTLAFAYKRKRDPLFEVKWLRVVLDEAHTIRNPRSQMATAAYELNACRRWALTGTPIQNRLLDLWSIVKFLRVKPLDERVFWRQCIERPINQRKESGVRVIQAMMKAIAMRRTKTQQVDGKPLIELPARTMKQETVNFSDDERGLYEAMLHEGRLTINRYIEEGTILHHSAQVLAILMRLRQLCCHPYLVRLAAERAKKLGLIPATAEIETLSDDQRKTLAQDLVNLITAEDAQGCPVCLETPPVRPVMNPSCKHYYCRVCIDEWIHTRGMEAKCPMCRGDLEPKKFVEGPDPDQEKGKGKDDNNIEPIGGKNWHSSVKVDAMMTHLLRLRQEDPTIKSIVISQFTSFLDVIEVPLIKENFNFVRLDGTMTAPERTEAIQLFQSKQAGSPTIFLLSMKAGGVGINLTAATRVFLMDPAWNPSAEEQCFDRCHRLGQTKDVEIFKFIVGDSIEERMLELQESKRMLMTEAFGGGKKRNQSEFIKNVRKLLS